MDAYVVLVSMLNSPSAFFPQNCYLLGFPGYFLEPANKFWIFTVKLVQLNTEKAHSLIFFATSGIWVPMSRFHI